VLAADATRALSIVQQISEQGYDLLAFARDFLALLRDLVVAKIVAEPGPMLDLADEERADVLSIARGADASDLERLFIAWSRTVDEVARAREPRWVLEMALVRIAHRPALVPVEELLGRLAELERRLLAGSGGTDPRTPPRGAPPAPSRPGGASGSSAPVRTASASPTATGATSSNAAPVAPIGPRASAARFEIVRSASAPATALAEASMTTAPAPVTPAPPSPKWLENVRVRGAQSGVPAEATPSPTAAPTPAPRVDLLDVRAAEAHLDAWATVLAALEGAPLAILEQGVPLEVSEKKISLAFETNSFYARKVSATDVQEAVRRAAQRALALAEPPAFELVTGSLPERVPSIAQRREAQRQAERAAKLDAARSHPLVRRFLSIVGGELRKIELPGDIPSS
jgi:DNA polymerase-3 subunit gamma/tau